VVAIRLHRGRRRPCRPRRVDRAAPRGRLVRCGAWPAGSGFHDRHSARDGAWRS